MTRLERLEEMAKQKGLYVVKMARGRYYVTPHHLEYVNKTINTDIDYHEVVYMTSNYDDAVREIKEYCVD